MSINAATHDDGPALLASDERDLLRSSFSRFLEAAAPGSVTAHLAGCEARARTKAWLALDEHCGLHALALSPDAGGLGLDPTELAAMFEEVGARLAPVPLLASGGGALLANDLLARGKAVPWDVRELVALDWVGLFTGAATRLDAMPGADGTFLVSGVTGAIPDADFASWLVVPARLGDEERTIVIQRQPGTCEVESVTNFDLTRPHARWTLRGARAELVELGDGAIPALRRWALLMMAAEHAGLAANRLREMTEHVTLRHQFGQPIGSFQAIAHACVDVMVAVEGARALLTHGVQACRSASPDIDLAVDVACAQCFAAADLAAAKAIELYGAIGFTWESSAHLYYRRVAANRFLFGLSCTRDDAIADAAIGEACDQAITRTTYA